MAKKQGAVTVALRCKDCNSRNYFQAKTAVMGREGQKVSGPKYCKTERRRTEHIETKMPNTKPQAQKR